jgi:hypothetical protein
MEEKESLFVTIKNMLFFSKTSIAPRSFPMTTVTQTSSKKQITALKSHVQSLFHERADFLARETAFVQRTTPITGSVFAQTLVFGFLTRPDASYTQLRHITAAQGVMVTAQAIEKRMTERAATFMLRLLEATVGCAMSGDPVALAIFSRFEGVYLQDGSTIALPAALASIWKGGGNKKKGAGESGIQLQIRLNLKTGEMQGPSLQAARCSEVKGALSMQEAPLPKGALWVVDMGFFSIATMLQMITDGQYWITYAKSDLTMSEVNGKRCSLVELMSKYDHQKVIDIQVFVGVKGLPARLIAFRLTEKQAQDQREKAKTRAKTRGKGCRRDVRTGKRIKPLSLQSRKHGHMGKKRRQLAHWTILLTNVPQTMLSPQDARIILRARWQIELVWKLWKERGQVDIWRSEKPFRVLCEVYAKLIGMVLQHWLLLVGCWSNPHRSQVKASQAIQLFAPCFLLALDGWFALEDLIVCLSLMMQGSHLNTRQQRPNTSQRLIDPSLVTCLKQPKIA